MLRKHLLTGIFIFVIYGTGWALNDSSQDFAFSVKAMPVLSCAKERAEKANNIPNIEKIQNLKRGRAQVV